MPVWVNRVNALQCLRFNQLFAASVLLNSCVLAACLSTAPNLKR